jgi:hypothetical protein
MKKYHTFKFKSRGRKAANKQLIEVMNLTKNFLIKLQKKGYSAAEISSAFYLIGNIALMENAMKGFMEMVWVADRISEIKKGGIKL